MLKFNRRESEIVSEGSSVISPKEVFPEYFLLRVNQFNEVAKTPIEEWMEYLKNGNIRADTSTPGLQEARQKLDFMKMTIQDRRAYERFIINLHADRDVWETAKRDGWNEGLKAGRAKGMKEGRAEGRAEGMKEGRAEGRAEGLLFAAKNMKQKGVPIDTITEVTGLTKEQVESL